MAQKLIVLVLVVLVAAGGLLAYSFLKEPEAATGPMTAMPLGGQPLSPAAAASDGQAAEPSVPSAAPAGAATVFELAPGQSEARFIIDEVLRGAPTTVVGRTDQVAGQLAIDPAELSAAQVGTIQVNARTIATDQAMRNRAIKNRILRTDQYELITFVPRQVVGLSGGGAVGQSYSFQIVGDLTIAGVTREVTFDVTATPTSATRLEGLATTEFPYRDFELSIPDSPSVDTVADQVRLELEFVAEAVS